MIRKFIPLLLVGAIFFSAVLALRQIDLPVLSSANKTELRQFELLTDETEQTHITKEVLLSSPLVIVGKGNSTPFTPIQVIAETNRHRQANGNAVLAENTKLSAAAEMKVRDMFEQQYFEHISPVGAGPDSLAQKVGYEYVSIGENLALGNFGDEGGLVDAWMQSPGHRANILRSQFQEIGVAIGRGEYNGRQVLIAVQEFGRPIDSCPRVDTVAKKTIESDKVRLTVIGENLKMIKNDIDVLATSSNLNSVNYESKVASYNDEVNVYNALAQSIKQKTNTYNIQVRAFNTCLKTST